MAHLSKNPSKYNEDLKFVDDVLTEASGYNLTTEVVLEALRSLKNNNKLSIREALQEGLDEWVK
jgi:hypothetical protein